LGGRQQLQQLLADCHVEPANYLLIQRLDALGDTIEEVSDRLTQLESLGIEVIATEQSYNSSQLTTSDIPNIRANLFKLMSEIQKRPM
jgi:DNA invertase Pin-like site-specific DNA recombinase